jgi:magnesium chelatase family protein
LATIFPPLTLEEALETTKIHSIVGLLAHGQALVTQRLFRAPHHTASDAGLLGRNMEFLKVNVTQSKSMSLGQSR